MKGKIKRFLAIALAFVMLFEVPELAMKSKAAGEKNITFEETDKQGVSKPIYYPWLYSYDGSLYNSLEDGKSITVDQDKAYIYIKPEIPEDYSNIVSLSPNLSSPACLVDYVIENGNTATGVFIANLSAAYENGAYKIPIASLPNTVNIYGQALAYKYSYHNGSIMAVPSEGLFMEKGSTLKVVDYNGSLIFKRTNSEGNEEDCFDLGVPSNFSSWVKVADDDSLMNALKVNDKSIAPITAGEEIIDFPYSLKKGYKVELGDDLTFFDGGKKYAVNADGYYCDGDFLLIQLKSGVEAPSKWYVSGSEASNITLSYGNIYQYAVSESDFNPSTGVINIDTKKISSSMMVTIENAKDQQGQPVNNVLMNVGEDLTFEFVSPYSDSTNVTVVDWKAGGDSIAVDFQSGASYQFSLTQDLCNRYGEEITITPSIASYFNLDSGESYEDVEVVNGQYLISKYQSDNYTITVKTGIDYTQQTTSNLEFSVAGTAAGSLPEATNGGKWFCTINGNTVTMSLKHEYKLMSNGSVVGFGYAMDGQPVKLEYATNALNWNTEQTKFFGGFRVNSNTIFYVSSIPVGNNGAPLFLDEGKYWYKMGNTDTTIDTLYTDVYTVSVKSETENGTGNQISVGSITKGGQSVNMLTADDNIYLLLAGDSDIDSVTLAFGETANIATVNSKETPIFFPVPSVEDENVLQAWIYTGIDGIDGSMKFSKQKHLVCNDPVTVFSVDGEEQPANTSDIYVWPTAEVVLNDGGSEGDRFVVKSASNLEEISHQMDANGRAVFTMPDDDVSVSVKVTVTLKDTYNLFEFKDNLGGSVSSDGTDVSGNRFKYYAENEKVYVGLVTASENTRAAIDIYNGENLIAHDNGHEAVVPLTFEVNPEFKVIADENVTIHRASDGVQYEDLYFLPGTELMAQTDTQSGYTTNWVYDEQLLTPTSTDDSSMMFTMPNGAIAIGATFSPVTYLLRFDESKLNIYIGEDTVQTVCQKNDAKTGYLVEYGKTLKICPNFPVVEEQNNGLACDVSIYTTDGDGDTLITEEGGRITSEEGFITCNMIYDDIRIDVTDMKYSYTYIDPDNTEEAPDYKEAGASISLSAPVVDGKDFLEWVVVDMLGNDVTSEVLGSGSGLSITSFIMPNRGIKITAVYEDIAVITIGAPVRLRAGRAYSFGEAGSTFKVSGDILTTYAGGITFYVSETKEYIFE